MIDREAALPIKRQAQLLGISRGTVYYHPEPVGQAELALMRRIDELHLEHPFAGSRMLRDLLRLQGVEVGRRHVGTLMRRMGIQALYRKPNTSKKHPAHPVFPYALRGLAIERANQVWALDITYIPMARGWVYLVVVLDWASRRVLAHRLSITMEADFCVEALREAAARWGAPEIVNTDQGSQFSSAEFIAEVQHIGVLQEVLFQQLDQKLMHVGALVVGHAFALEVGHAADGRILGHHHGLYRWAGHGGAGIHQRRASGLRKDGRRFAYVTKVDGADVERLQLHGACVELGPGHLHAQRGQALFQRATGFDEREPAFLVAHPQHRDGGGLGKGRGGQACSGQAGGQAGGQHLAARG